MNRATPMTGTTSMTMAGQKVEPDPVWLPVKRYLNPGTFLHPVREDHEGEPGVDETSGQGHHDVGHPRAVDYPANGSIEQGGSEDDPDRHQQRYGQRLLIHHRGRRRIGQHQHGTHAEIDSPANTITA